MSVLLHQGNLYSTVAVYPLHVEYRVTDPSLPITFPTLVASRWAGIAEDVDFFPMAPCCTTQPEPPPQQPVEPCCEVPPPPPPPINNVLWRKEWPTESLVEWPVDRPDQNPVPEPATGLLVLVAALVLVVVRRRFRA